MPIAPGDVVLHFRFVEPIGEGGMGVAWRAFDTSLNREVAIKVLPPAVSGNVERVSRFEREAKVLSDLNHPNIAAAIAFYDTDVEPFIEMEYVEGEALDQWFAHSRGDQQKLLDVFKQIAEAIEAAHEQGVVHRDLKPANIRVRADGVVKVLDFGLARMLTAEPGAKAGPEATTDVGGFTEPHMIVGTAPYMSPEQARGDRADRRSDIWALGCIMYEGLAGHRAFGGATPPEVLKEVVYKEPDFSAVPANTPPFLEQLIRRCLDKDRRRRLRDAGELRIAIETYQADPTSVHVVGVEPPASAKSQLPAMLPWIVVAILAATLAVLLLRG